VSAASGWRGVFPALCTTFTPADGIDLEAQQRVVRFALEAGAHGLVCFGLAGEVLKLAPAERTALTAAIVESAEGRVPVLVGVGAESRRTARELARGAEAAGASGIVLQAPLSGAVDAGGVVEHLVSVAGEVSLPVMVQDAPAYLGVALGPEVVERAGERAANLRLVKLEAGPAEMSRWLDRLGPDFGIWGGDGGIHLLDCVRTGAAGIIPGVDLVDLLVGVHAAEAAGHQERADELFRRVLPMLVFEMQGSIDHFNWCAKHVLARRGVPLHVGLRQPAGELPAASLALLERHLRALDLAPG
jgi:4-hydroxy-tetrahydrodipicolinate synthase